MIAFLFRIMIGLCNNSGDATIESAILLVRFALFSDEVKLVSLDLKRVMGFSSFSIVSKSSISILLRGSSK